jgi:hypothetical protein
MTKLFNTFCTLRLNTTKLVPQHTLGHWPKCGTHSLFFTFSELKFFKFDNVNALRAQLIIPSKPNIYNLFEFPEKNPLKNQYLSHLSSENCEINSIKSDSPEGFLTTPRTPPNSNTVFSFHWENDSIINSFLHTVASNSLKPSQCTPTHQKLSEKIREHSMKHHGLGDLISAYNKTKQTTLFHTEAREPKWKTPTESVQNQNLITHFLWQANAKRWF